MHTAITTTNLTKQYGNRCIVAQVSLQVGQGEIYAFLGLNGAGKTTTIRMLLGMIRPTSGAAYILGMPVQPDAHELWSQVGYLVETPYAYPELTVRENLEIARRLHGVRDAQVVSRTIDQLALTHYADQRSRTLSLGNAQRLGLAKALLHHPHVVILDEPANGLDPAGVVEVRELLRDLAHWQGVTIFMSSHLLSEVAHIATRFGIIHQGRLLEEVDATEMERRRHRWVEIDARDRESARTALLADGIAVADGADGALMLTSEEALAHPEQIASRLVHAGVALTRLSVEEEDLETQFLRLVNVKQEEHRDAIRS